MHARILDVIEHVHTIERRTIGVRRSRLIVEQVEQERIVCACGYVSHWRAISNVPFRRLVPCAIDGQQSLT